MRQSDWTHQISLSFQVRLQFHISISENGVELFRTQTVIHIYDSYTIRLQGNENEVETEGESTFDPVEKMQQFGINASDIQKAQGWRVLHNWHGLENTAEGDSCWRARTVGLGDREGVERGKG